MYQVKGTPMYRPGDKKTVVNVAQEHPYTHFERALNGDWSEASNDAIIAEVLRVVAIEFDPSTAISALEQAKIEAEADIEEAKNELSETKTELENLKTKAEDTERRSRSAEKVLNSISRVFLVGEDLTDEQRDEIVGQYRAVGVGDTVAPGEVVRIQGKLYEMIQPSPVTIHDEAWLGDPSIFADFINPTTEEGEVVVEEFKQPTGAHDAYETGDVVLFNGVMYESVIDGNVWSPADNPAGWSIIEE